MKNQYRYYSTIIIHLNEFRTSGIRSVKQYTASAAYLYGGVVTGASGAVLGSDVHTTVLVVSIKTSNADVTLLTYNNKIV